MYKAFVVRYRKRFRGCYSEMRFSTLEAAFQFKDAATLCLPSGVMVRKAAGEGIIYEDLTIGPRVIAW